ncbi:hypothetical protein OG723_44635 (plasmid) [Streptomyces sp. NBC_01278]|uniref:hypothetical protein n=1 Tax=Streptomyces sp. NBC_01278 TaxID=2903809 RepID=UPI002E3281B3|nr:hypothetical protein [Streptomyces sp. NBC_01278]
MRITVTIEEPTPEALRDLDAFLTKHAAVVQTDTAWTPTRARDYYDELPARAKTILREALRRGGRVPADALRSDDNTSLRGHAKGLKTTLAKGVTDGLWPHGVKPPVIPIGPGYGKVQGYRVRDEALPAFAEGLAFLLTKEK